MRSLRFFLLIGLSLVAFSLAGAGETITVSGTEHRNAEWVDVCREGLIYKTESGAFVTLTWDAATPAQVSGARTKKPEAFDHALYDAYWVKGTVFQVKPDGVIIQVEIPEEHKEIGYKDGAKILENGLVIVKDLPTAVPQGEGAAIEIVAHKRGTFTFDLAIAVKEIPLLTVAKPLWAIEQEWKTRRVNPCTPNSSRSRKARACLKKVGSVSFTISPNSIPTARSVPPRWLRNSRAFRFPEPRVEPIKMTPGRFS